MPSFDHVVECDIGRTPRTSQLEAMFDVPAAEKSRREWHVELPIEGDDWKVGLIVGPSGSGKTQIARRVWGDAVDSKLTWGRRAVVDSFAAGLSMEQISGVCMAVGFNTIPSWMRPYAVLSNGEQFRVALARRLLESGDTVIVDEFTSVVDRQVAKIAAHAVQKFIRRAEGKRFVAVTCHYDVLDWLQPDWVYDPSTQEFARRSLRQRPELGIAISPVPYSTWKMFAPFHYLTAELHKAARCFCLFVDGRAAAFAGMLHRAGVHKKPIMGCSRLVTLPDFQGLGLAFVLIDAVASIYSAIDKAVHTYPAHPALIRGFDKSANWVLKKKPGTYSAATSKSGALQKRARAGANRPGTEQRHSTMVARQGGRPCAVFGYAGAAMDKPQAEAVLAYWGRTKA